MDVTAGVVLLAQLLDEALVLRLGADYMLQRIACALAQIAHDIYDAARAFAELLAEVVPEGPAAAAQRSILWPAGVDVFVPQRDAAGHGFDVFVAGVAEHLCDLQ